MDSAIAIFAILHGLETLYLHKIEEYRKRMEIIEKRSYKRFCHRYGR